MTKISRRVLTVEPGSLLIAKPLLKNESYKRAVVLLAEDDKLGSTGFILNKPAGYPVSEGVEDFPDFDAPLYYGGPADTGHLYYIHTLGPDYLPYCLEIVPGLWWGGDYDELLLKINTKQIRSEDDKIRFYAGYSGWEPGQVMDQVKKEETWIASSHNNISKYAFYKKTKNLWRDVLWNMGDEFAILANFPEDPNMN